jgi:cyclopropane-fatty-acyl-phospholipid synthase
MVTQVSQRTRRPAPGTGATPTPPDHEPDPIVADRVVPERTVSGPAAAPAGSAAEAVAPMLAVLFGDAPPVRFSFWDGSSLGPVDGPGTLHVHSPDAVRRILWAPGELGVARAFVWGDVTVEGDLLGMLRALRDGSSRDLRTVGWRSLAGAARAARRMGALGSPLPPPPEESRPAGRRHSPARDARAVSHHYDVGNDFYGLVLGPSMTYSCARFVTPTTTLEEAQAAKHELVCRKLGLDQRPGARLLDVGCGWGSMALHAARHHGAEVVGVTLSRQQADLARERVRESGLDDRVEIRLQDYRALHGEQFDAISSIGMFEHVGSTRTAQYFDTLRGLLGPTGRLLNHAISKPGGSMLGRHTFVGRYVFPDGELLDVGRVVLAMQQSGFEVRDVESLREHYSRTLRSWVQNLDAHWDECVALVGLRRANVWRLYMAASTLGFDDGGLAIHQVLGVVPAADGTSGMPSTRIGWG